MDEISTTGYTKVSECRDGVVNTFYVHPADYGLPKTTLASLEGGDAPTNAAMIHGVFGGDPGPLRDVVLLNAGAALFVAGVAASVSDGIALAAEAIDSGRARVTLDALVESSQSIPVR